MALSLATKRTNRTIASNRLFHNEVHDFTEAVATLTAAIADERAWHREYLAKWREPEHDPNPPTAEELFADDELAAQRALALYADERSHFIRRTATAMRAAGLDEWADALERDDYTSFAI